MAALEDLSALRREKLIRLYRADPEAYAADVLGVVWWSKQIEIAHSFAERGKTAAKACHGVGKSHVMAGLVNWHFDLFNPGLTITTAPTQAQVEDILWKEIRAQRAGRPGLMPAAPRMETSDKHFAAGYTAADANSFQGRHKEHLGVIFDEAVGIDGQFFEAVEGMICGGATHWAAIYNPTDITSRMHDEELTGDWNVITISALDHPNVIAALEGRPEPYPGAVSLQWVKDRLKRWADPLGFGEKLPGDIEFPPGSGVWYRPGPLFESRVLGRWPSAGFNTVWSEALWNYATERRFEVPLEPLQIGCDVARYGDDYTAIHLRRGPVSLHHERYNGWGTNETAGRLKQLAREYADVGEDPQTIAIVIDDDGVGGGVVDQDDGFNFIGLSAAETAVDPEDYPNRRSELWFGTQSRAKERRLDLSRLPIEIRLLLRRQLLTPTWKLDSQGRRVVEAKEAMKARLKKQNPQLTGGSPDDADALNLAYAPVTSMIDTNATGYIPNSAPPGGGYRPQL